MYKIQYIFQYIQYIQYIFPIIAAQAYTEDSVKVKQASGFK